MFIAHISGMDAFARALIAADEILSNSDYSKMITDRYSSFDSGKGREFELGKLSLEELRSYALSNGEPPLRSGSQELYEQLISMYL